MHIDRRVDDTIKCQYNWVTKKRLFLIFPYANLVKALAVYVHALICNKMVDKVVFANLGRLDQAKLQLQFEKPNKYEYKQIKQEQIVIPPASRGLLVYIFYICNTIPILVRSFCL